MNEIVSAIREKYPQYADIGDDDLTLKIADTYPSYLKNKSFADDVERLRPTKAKVEEDFHVAPSESPVRKLGPLAGTAAIAGLGVNKAMEFAGRGMVGAANTLLGASPEKPILEYGKPLIRLAEPLTQEEESQIPPAAAGIYRSVSKAANQLTTPEMALSLPLLGMKPVQAAFAAQMGLSLPEQVATAKEVIADPKASTIEKFEAVTDPVITGGLAALATKHALSPIERTPNAIPKREAERVPENQPPGNISPVGEGTREQAATPEQGAPNVPPKEPVANRVDALELALSDQPKPETPVESKGPSGGNISAFGPLDPATYKPLIDAASPYVKEAADAVLEAGKEALKGREVNDQRRSVLDWSAKLQRSFGEADRVQRELKKQVPDKVRRDAITNWIQADGDANLLAQRAAASKPGLREGYEAAQKLTPEELNIAKSIQKKYGELFTRGSHYDILNSFRDNYVTQIWDLGKGIFSGITGSSRTLKDRFKFSKARTFDSFFDGEQAGFTPKTKDISKLLPIYMHEMESVISARQLAEQLAKGKASDGRPLAVPRGIGVPVDNAGDKATLVMPKVLKEDVTDYKVLENQPALSDWRWVSKDEAGNPVFLKADLALHPEAYAHLKKILGQSAIKEWYRSEGTALAAIPKALVKGLDVGQSEVKRTMLGLFAPFHQVQEATHAVGHRVNPTFNIPRIDLKGNADQMDAARHGLMLLPDKTSADQFMEGFRHSGIVSRFPIIGPAADWYSHYLFQEYIPGLKFKTYQAILDRNTKVYSDKLASGEVKPSDVKVLSAEQTNAAYGHLNYSDLGRNPTIQHLMQIGLLAPDFLEARGRFAAQAIKGVTGAKAGREQLLALATLAVAQATGAWIGAQATGGQWDPKHPFEFVKDKRRYTLRSVPEDMFRLMADTRAFVYARLNPIVGRGTMQYISGVDWRGQKKTAMETTKELAQSPIPLMLRPLVGASNTPLKWWEEMLSAVGLKISRYSAQQEVRQMVDKFKRDSGNQKLIQEAERASKEVFPDSDYKPLREALIKGNEDEARKAYAKLLETKKRLVIEKAMRPVTAFKIPGTDYYGSHVKAFTGSNKVERAFVKSLSPEQKEIYDEALAERKEVYMRFRDMLKGIKSQNHENTP